MKLSLTAVLAGLLAVAAAPFRDPAPPEVRTPQAMAPPPAKTNPDVRFHAKPKPLPRGAVMTAPKHIVEAAADQRVGGYMHDVARVHLRLMDRTQ